MKKAATLAVFAAAMLLALILQGGNTYASSAVNNDNYEKALDLKILGIFNGTNEGFELERAPSRVEGAVMLLRLLGKESEAASAAYRHPFTDVPKWADSYIGYMYSKGLTSGYEPTLFGSDQTLSCQQYVTFVLRALGYDDKSNDFSYSAAIEMAVRVKLLSSTDAQLLNSSKSFLRNDLTEISYNALTVKLNDSNKTLLDKLVTDEKSIFKPAATVLGLLTSDLQAEYGNIEDYTTTVTGNGYISTNSSDLFKLLRKAIYTYQTQITIDISKYNGDIFGDFEGVCEKASAAVTKSTGVDNILAQWSYKSYGDSFTLTLGYRFTKSEFETKKKNYKETIYKARYIVVNHIRTGMSDYDKELVLHDYLVNNTEYDYDDYIKGNVPDDSFSAYGTIVLGTAVCQGYSYAMKLLSDLSGLECIVVSGSSRSSGTYEGHAWNIVKVDGSYYHLDVTFDDPVIANSSGMLTHYYFNVTDKELAKKHKWDATAYPVCNSSDENYYNKNGLVADNIYEFNDALLSAMALRQTDIEIKVSNYSAAVYSDFADVMYGSDTVTGFYYIVNTEFGVIRLFDIEYS